MKRFPGLIGVLFVSGVITGCGMEPKGDKAAHHNFPLTIVITGQAVEKSGSALPEQLLQLAVPFRDEDTCPKNAFFPQADLVRLDVASIRKTHLERLDAGVLEKLAASKREGQAGKVQGFFGKKPAFEKLQEVALEKLKSEKADELLAQPGDREPAWADDLAAIQQQTKASKVFVLTDPDSARIDLPEGLSDQIEAGGTFETAEDPKDLMRLMAKALCPGDQSSGHEKSEVEKPSQLPSLVIAYRPSFDEAGSPAGSADVVQSTTSLGRKSSAGSVKVAAKKAGRDPSPEAQQHLQQGMIYVKLKDWSNALLEFGQAIDIEEKHKTCYATAYMNRGIALMLKKDLNLAQADMSKALECDPGNPMVHYNMTALYAVKSQSDLALVSLDKALETGFADCEALRRDTDLKNIRRLPAFRKTLEKHGKYCL